MNCSIAALEKLSFGRIYALINVIFILDISSIDIMSKLLWMFMMLYCTELWISNATPPYLVVELFLL